MLRVKPPSAAAVFVFAAFDVHLLLQQLGLVALGSTLQSLWQAMGQVTLGLNKTHLSLAWLCASVSSTVTRENKCVKSCTLIYAWYFTEEWQSNFFVSSKRCFWGLFAFQWWPQSDRRSHGLMSLSVPSSQPHAECSLCSLWLGGLQPPASVAVMGGGGGDKTARPLTCTRVQKCGVDVCT